MCDAQNPRQELAAVQTAQPPFGGGDEQEGSQHGLDEGLLKDVVGRIAVLDQHVNVVPDATPMTLDKMGNGIPIACKILIKQGLVA